MSKMLVKAAKALVRAQDFSWEAAAPEIAAPQGNPNRADYIRHVRAVLAAIREPDEEMIAAGLVALELGSSNSNSPGCDAYTAWEAMIDALLADGMGRAPCPTGQLRDKP